MAEWVNQARPQPPPPLPPFQVAAGTMSWSCVETVAQERESHVLWVVQHRAKGADFRSTQ